jgi:L-fuculose-phosphate aldolase
MNSIVDAVRKLCALGLNRNSSGNCSIRTEYGFCITPSGASADSLSEHSLVKMRVKSGEVDFFEHSTQKPSSEWRFHHDIYAQRPEVQAIIHTHSPFATTLACLHRDIPAFHYMIALAGGTNIRCAPYALFGTQELSNLTIEALHGRKACLLANHGMIAIGSSLEDAMRVAIEVESLAEQYWRVLQIGEPKLLTDLQMAEVLEKFKTYGLRASTSKPT